jgi:hypothetical protein
VSGCSAACVPGGMRRRRALRQTVLRFRGSNLQPVNRRFVQVVAQTRGATFLEFVC